MSSLSQQGLKQKQRKPMESRELGSQEKKREWLTLVSHDGGGDTSEPRGDMKAEIRRLENEVKSLSKKLHDLNNELLWRDTLAARHAEAYALAEQQVLQDSSAG
jgi:ribosomal 50S subunit-associated protein YjgA (DUF615 family)